MYTIYFKDKTKWKGGDLTDSKWNDMPNKPIFKIEYNLLDRLISISGFEKYNHIIEHISIFNKKKLISKTILMGLKDNKIYNFVFDIYKNKISYDNVEVNKEYLGKKTTGWKTGIKNSKPIIDLNCKH